MSRARQKRIDGRRARRFLLSLVVAGLSAIAVVALASDTLQLSPNVTTVLGSATLRDENVGSDDLAGSVTLGGPPGLPEGADLIAYHRDATGELFTLDVPATVGGIAVEPGDVVRWDGGDFNLFLDGSAEDIPAGVAIDAIARDSPLLLVSFDVTVTLDGVTFADEDVASFNAGTFAMALDGSSVGIPESLDLDGLEYHQNENLYFLSFDTAGSVGGVSFADEDVLQLDPSGPVWTMFYDGSVEHDAWVAADLDALSLDEPTATPTPTGTPSVMPSATPTPTATNTPTPTPTATSTGATLDIDGDGQIESLTDGLLVLRYLFGFRGNTLVANAVDTQSCSRCLAAQIEPYIASKLGQLDIDGDGQNESLTDGVLVLRYLFGFRGNTLVSNAIDTDNCTRCTAGQIEPYIAGLL